MPRPVVSVLGELECWVTFSPRARRWLHVVSWCSPSLGAGLYARRPRRYAEIMVPLNFLGKASYQCRVATIGPWRIVTQLMNVTNQRPSNQRHQDAVYCNMCRYYSDWGWPGHSDLLQRCECRACCRRSSLTRRRSRPRVHSSRPLVHYVQWHSVVFLWRHASSSIAVSTA